MPIVRPRLTDYHGILLSEAAKQRENAALGASRGGARPYKIQLRRSGRIIRRREAPESPRPHPPCYDSIVFNLGSPKTGGDWIVHIAGAIVAIFLVWWMLRLYVL